MVSYERMFGDGPELTVLRYLGLFDRLATSEALAALRAEPPLLARVDARSWQRALHRLRQVGLVAREASPGEPLDTHPLVREHFGSRLKERSPEVWVEGHRRLYEHYRRAAPDLPDTLAEMEPLFAAVIHGTAAGRHEEVITEVVWRRALHTDEFYLYKKLGAFSAFLACLTPFFAERWCRPLETLIREDANWLLGMTGFALGALGRPHDASEPTETALDRRINDRDWPNAARVACNLSELHVTLGDLGRAEARAREAVELADMSHDTLLEIVARTTLADALHHPGDSVAAQTLFEGAESRQRARQPAYPQLYSIRGYRDCDLLLEQGDPAAVERRATQALKWFTADAPLLDIALYHLSLGRARLALDQLGRARGEFDLAIDGFRAAGYLDDLTRGLLARAAFRREANDLVPARRDLAEALKLAERSGFRLCAADCALEGARIALAESQSQGLDAADANAKLAEARSAFRRAQALVETMSYGRRRPELAELARALGEAGETETKQ